MGERVENITERGIRRRRAFGIVMLVVSLVAAAALVASDAPRWWRLSLAVPFALAAMGFLEAREKTCVVLGAMGARETPEGGYARMTPAECTIARRQGRAIIAKDVAIGLAAAGLIWLI